MPAAIPHEMILASAGSGKTWQLTNRYIGLMAQQYLAGEEVTPERIVAVTFTRKAAGEFFDSILLKLAKAASDADYAQRLAAPAEDSPENDPLSQVLQALKPADYRSLLRQFVDKMPRLFLGTLDSFFSSILRSFPAEYGLAGEFEILSEHQALSEREKVYRQVFRRALHGHSEAQKEFMEAFRRATFGKEKATVRSLLDGFIENQHEILLHAAPEALWGNAKVIWPQGCPWLRSSESLNADFARLLDLLRGTEMTEEQEEFWLQFHQESLQHIPGSTLPARVEYFMTRLLELWSELSQGAATVLVARKKQSIEGEACLHLKNILTSLVSAEVVLRLERTRGVWKVLHLYEKHWSQQVRRQGRLTFQDMEWLLAGHEYASQTSRPLLSQQAGPDARLRIDYRLDARYDHWLLDEFQDTNRVQWSVIENLIDEVVQDTSQQRTLFQVGDTKQAIYAWRGGDMRLFSDILQRYNSQKAKRIHTRPLHVSYRSGPDVIHTANLIFGEKKWLQELNLPQQTLQNWHWEDHLVPAVHAQLKGHCLWLEPKPQEGEKVTDEDKWAITAELLREMQPIARGIRCAIIVQTNDVGRAIVDYLRAHLPSIPVMSEAEISIATDNALNLALLSLIQCATHPGDTFSWQHLQMTPFRAIFEELGITPSRLCQQVNRQIFDHGFEFTLRFWLGKLALTDAFSLARAEEFCLAARLFDQSGVRQADEFLEYAKNYTLREPNTRQAVQVMTIHKSKGLTFDCAILPDLEGDSLTTVRRGIGVSRDEKQQVEWVYDLPPSTIVRADPVLAAYRQEREAEAAYEELCKFYVALTRARKANYLITKPRSSKSVSQNFVKLLELSLPAPNQKEWQLGNSTATLRYSSQTTATQAQWYMSHQAPPSEAAEERPALPPFQPEARQRLSRRTPSGSEESVITAAQLFSKNGRIARAFGTLVHACFEQITWLDKATNESQLQALWSELPFPDSDLRQRVEKEVLTCLRRPEVRAALAQPGGEAELWREKRFEILLGQEWLSGTFDRVVIQPHRAMIFDFKTDKVTDVDAQTQRIQTYRPQLSIYREVLHRMTGLPLESIQCYLLFTHRQEVVEVKM